MKRVLLMNIENNYTRISVVNTSFKSIEFLDTFEVNLGLTSFEEVNSKKSYEKKLEELLERYDKFDEIYFIIQNEKVIVREYKNICNLKTKDIQGYINYEIAKDMPISLDNYVVRYKILEKLKDTMTLQIILFPKFIRDVCLSIAYRFNIRKKYLNINFDIIQKLIALKKFNFACKDYLIFEILREQIIINYIKDDIIMGSKIFGKDRNIEYIRSFFEKDINIFYFGKEDEFLKKLLENEYKVDKLELAKNKKYININKTVDKSIENYSLEIGVLL